MTGRVCALGAQPHYMGGHSATGEPVRGNTVRHFRAQIAGSAVQSFQTMCRLAAVWLMLALSPVFSGTVLAGDNRGTAGGPPGEATNVVVTIKPIHSLVAQVMDGVGTPLLLVEGSASPHSFSLKPSQVGAINRAAVFFRVSEWLEPFTGKVARVLPSTVELVSLIDTPGLERLARRKTGTFETHDHAGEHAHREGHGHDHTHEHAVTMVTDGVSDGVVDSHIWLDPENAKRLVSRIADVLSRHYPAHAAKFAANAATARVRIDDLAGALQNDLGAVKDRPFIVFHDAYQYFDVRFGLNAVGSITVSPDVRPSAKRLSALRKRIRSLKAACVFAEPMYQPRLVQAVIEGTDARSGTLDPEGMLLEPGAELYEKLMRGRGRSERVSGCDAKRGLKHSRLYA